LIGCGARVLGPIRIGRGAFIGATPSSSPTFRLARSLLARGH
jgi:hypothetical protein